MSSVITGEQDVTESAGSSMARIKKKSQRNDVVVKVDRAIVGKAKMIATHRGISVAEMLTDAARPAIDRAYAQMLRELDGTAK
jgi:hypothetical protein